MFGPRRGPTFNNRWWNDRRSWNLRTTNRREKASPKGANRIQSCSCSPPSGTIESMSAIRRFHSLRSFHQRLFTFAPFGDGRHELPAFPDFSVRRVSPLGVPPDLQSGGALRTHSSSSLFAFQKICKALRDLTEIIWWFRIIDVYLQGRRMNYIKLKNTNNLTK